MNYRNWMISILMIGTFLLGWFIGRLHKPGFTEARIATVQRANALITEIPWAGFPKCLGPIQSAYLRGAEDALKKAAE